MKKHFALLSAAAMLVVGSGAASAQTTVLVGKGEVQTALGWNNAQLQSNANNLTWSYMEESTVELVCQRENRNNTVTQTRTGSRTVSATVDYSTRGNRQVTGFVLQIGELIVSGSEPACPAAEDWEEVSREEVSSSDGLTVNGVPLDIVF
jgi:hypothetical protein